MALPNLQVGSKRITAVYEKGKVMTGLGTKFRAAVIWNTRLKLFRDLLQFRATFVLVRLLKPVSYGKFAMASSIMGFHSILLTIALSVTDCWSTKRPMPVNRRI